MDHCTPRKLITKDNIPTNRIVNLWIESSYVQQLRVICQLSGYPTLTSLCIILVYLAVTSCSAKRVTNGIRIVRNRLSSTMVDNWFAFLTVLACDCVNETLLCHKNWTKLLIALQRTLLR